MTTNLKMLFLIYYIFFLNICVFLSNGLGATARLYRSFSLHLVLGVFCS
uniref:Uncharacterized protein n=1 Tax=Anguilla anguilla TaxID=7936 RepID=A0A0E9PZ42_ANGAN